MSKLRSGAEEGVPYSLSRWTDICGTKWPWFESCLAAGQMLAFDPREGLPTYWSLKPEDTLGLVFWTKYPAPIVASQLRLQAYNVVVNVTATGWEEVEKGAPTLDEAGRLLIATAEAFPKTYWRFSPIPALPERVVLERFARLLDYAERAGLKQVFVSYLQSNDRINETRTAMERFDLLNRMSAMAQNYGVSVFLCQDDHSFDDWQGKQFSLEPCVRSEDFSKAGVVERCGCVMIVDPFTINETCTFGCQYCYAADQSLSPKKRNTTSLKVVR